MSVPWEHLRQIHSWREEIAKGERVGPRLLTAGPILDRPGTNRSLQLEIGNADEGREAVRRQKREGVDFIKVYDLLSRESYLPSPPKPNSRACHLPDMFRLASALGGIGSWTADAHSKNKSSRGRWTLV
jgi:hypothetical protein